MLSAIRFLLSGVCHQLPAHSYWAGGQPLPLCARCSGTFLGIWAGLLTLRLIGRHRRTGMPAGPAAWALGALAAAWAIDGVNSFVADALGRALYQPTNLLRLITGAGMGVAISAVVAPMIASVTLGDIQPTPVMKDWSSLVHLCVPMGVTIGGVLHSEWVPYPLAALMLAVAVLGALALLNAVLVRLAMMRWPAMAAGAGGCCSLSQRCWSWPGCVDWQGSSRAKP